MAWPSSWNGPGVADGHCDQDPQDDRARGRERDARRAEYVDRGAARAGVPLNFAVEINLAAMAGHADDRYYSDPKAVVGWACSTPEGRPGLRFRRVDLTDEWLDLAVGLRWSRPADLWCLPIETVSQSEGRVRRRLPELGRPPALGHRPPMSSRRWEVRIRWTLGIPLGPGRDRPRLGPRRTGNGLIADGTLRRAPRISKHHLDGDHRSCDSLRTLAIRPPPQARATGLAEGGRRGDRPQGPPAPVPGPPGGGGRPGGGVSSGPGPARAWRSRSSALMSRGTTSGTSTGT